MDLLETTSVSKIVGLVERVSDLKGPEDLAQIDDDLGIEKSEFFNIIDDAERLDLVKVVEGNIQLTDFGKKFVNSGIKERKVLLEKKLREVEPFKTLLKILEYDPDKKMKKDKFIEIIKKNFYTSDPDRVFKVFINWGRYAKLVGYSIDSDDVYIITN
ncbi:MAG: AAA-associated domain-containing protein [Thermoplasmata archaeon]